MHELAKNALAWFIVNDETYSGGQWEEGNSYWLNGLRASYRVFDSYSEIVRRATEYEKQIASGVCIPMTGKEEEDFMTK